MEQKIIVLGLDNAGKTSLLSRFGGTLGIDELASLEPTRGVIRREIDTKDMRFFIWDFGGQEDHRIQYIQDPEHYFIGIDLIIYVIDIKDDKRYNESISYLEKILNLVKKMGQNRYILIFIHKCDPEIKNTKETISNIDFLKKSIEPLLIEKDFEYEIFLTSIYSGFPKEPKFVNLVKQIIDGQPIKDGTVDLKLNRMAEVLESTMNAVIKISSNIMDIEDRIRNIEKSTVFSDKKLPKSDSKIKDIEILKNNTISQLKEIFVRKEE